MAYKRMITAFGGAWEENDKEGTPHRLDGLASTYEENGRWWSVINKQLLGPFKTKEVAMNFSDRTLRYQVISMS